MNKDIVKNCSFKKENFVPCWLMNDKLEPEANVGKGLVQVNVQCISDLSKGLPSICIGVFFKKTVKDSGIMLNFCPFCGGNIKGWERKEYQERKENLEVKK